MVVCSGPLAIEKRNGLHGRTKHISGEHFHFFLKLVSEVGVGKWNVQMLKEIVVMKCILMFMLCLWCLSLCFLLNS